MGDYIAGLGLDAARQYMNSKIDEHKLKSALKEYIERESQYNDVCRMAEECDFQGLVDYMMHDLLEDVKLRFFSTNADERRRAHEEIVAKAVAYSSASTAEAQKRVGRLVAVILEMVRQFFKKRISASDYLLAAEVVDAVHESTAQVVESAVSDVQHTLLETHKDMAEQLESVKQSIEKGSLYSVENMSQMVAAGQFSQAEKNVKKLLAGMSVEHPLYPDYGFTFDGDMLKSTPLSDAASHRYPARMVLKGTVSAGDHFFDDATEDPMDFAYRHQLKLVMSVSEAVKLLGNRPDPIQTEATQFVGKSIVAVPPEFPEAFPCSLKVGETTYFDYVMLRTEEIMDDGTYVIGNREQENAAICFKVKLNLECPSQSDFIISISNANCHDQLNFVSFMDELERVKELNIYALRERTDFVAGVVDGVNYHSGFPSVAEEIDFLKRVCAIADYFRVEMRVSGDISEEDFQSVYRISELILKDEVELTWEEVSFTGVMGPEFRRQLSKLDAPIDMLSYVGVCEVDMFGAQFDFRFMRTFRSAVVQESDRIKRLASCLEDGEPIKMKFVPGDDKGAFDTLHIPENLACADNEEANREEALEKLLSERSEEALWAAVVAFRGYEFRTYSGLPFSYKLKEGKDGMYTKELFIDRRENSKSLAWSSVLLAFRSLPEEVCIVGRPKALGDIRGITYIYGMFYRFGLIDVPEQAKEKMET